MKALRLTSFTAMRGDRSHEAGISLVEALVMVAVLAIVSALALDLVQGGLNRAFRQADRAAERSAAPLASDRFRRIIGNAVGAGAVQDSDAETLVVQTMIGSPGPCRAWPSTGRLVLRIVRDGDGVRITCTSVAGAETLAQWQRGDARFSYSNDGLEWQDRWTAGRTPPFVRLTLSDAASPATWVARPALTVAAP